MTREQFPNVEASADGRWIVGGFTQQRPHDSVALWDARSGALLWERPLEARLTVVAIDTATKTVAAEYLETDRSGELWCKVALFDQTTAQRRATILPRSEPYVGVHPTFTTDRRLLIHTKKQLEWWEPKTGRFLVSRTAPQGCPGFLLSTQSCGRFRIVEHMSTDPKWGIDPEKTRFGVEILSEKDGALCGTLLRNHPRLMTYCTHPETEVVALMLRDDDDHVTVEVHHAPTRTLVARRTFPGPADESLWFSSDGASLYLRIWVGSFQYRVWNWNTNLARPTRPRELRDFGTFFLGGREVYNQYWDGAIRDAQTDRLIVRLRSR